MRATATDAESIVGSFYEAALDSRHWRSSLTLLASYAGARGAVLKHGDLRRQRHVVASQSGHDAEVVRAYEERFHENDPLVEAASRVPDGAWLNDACAVPDLRASAFYRDFMLPAGNHFSMSTIVWRDGWNVAVLSLQRDASQGLFTADDEERLAPFMPHLRRALRLGLARQQLRAKAECRAAALDRLAVPLFVVDADARLALANAAADSLGRTSRMLGVSHGVLRSRAAEAQLHAAIAAAVVAARSTWLRIPALPGEEAMLLAVTPIGRPTQVGGRTAVLVMASRLAAPAATLHEVLRGMFGLTGAEVRLAHGFAEGLSILEVAQRHRIKVETVRGQLKSLFAKLGVRRQSELTRLVVGMHSLAPHDPVASTA
ncbi:MAG TPA: helix-turn-helix transcriptional regulator [Ramlibacter sp.]|uniref:helix-turn-helix transcriptional regulator n=1 Tax=Ramlibacter sp. TaxID=1917967 RepID=UPI002C8F46AD|nr:helix-turn-helix transcriptional regulator [Ramlibacter sp.]HVZ43368.1 helix-turn-helix transcriptional regulator [Ramlibacter sp.]